MLLICYLYAVGFRMFSQKEEIFLNKMTRACVSFLDFLIFFSPEGSKNITEESRNSKNISHIAL